MGCCCSFLASQVKLKSWEKRLVDELCGSDVKQLLKKAEEWETQYLKALPKPGIYSVCNYTFKEVLFLTNSQCVYIIITNVRYPI